MALPTLSPDQIDDIYVTTWNVKLPTMWDNVYNSNPFYALLNQRERILLDGGREIEVPFMYGKLSGGPYNPRTATFLNTYTETMSAFRIPWKYQHVDLAYGGDQEVQNAGAAAHFNNAEIQMSSAEFTLKDNLGTAMMANGTDAGGDQINGVPDWVDDGTNVATLGGVTRGTDAVGTAAKAVYDATGGSATIPTIQGLYGRTTIENEKDDLLLTTQTIWDALFNRVQPQQRYPVGPGPWDDLARIGFESIKFQRAAVLVDSHVQSGRMYGLNLNTWKLVVNKQRPGVFRGWMPITNQDKRVNQMWWSGNLVCQSPRLNFQARGLTA